MTDDARVAPRFAIDVSRRRLIEQQNSNCLKQSRMGIGDCAGLPEEELKAAMDESLRRLERRQAEAAAAAATTTTEEVTVG